MVSSACSRRHSRLHARLHVAQNSRVGRIVGYRVTVAKKTKRRGTDTASSQASSDTINPRQPCPCGSGRRYKACHGSADAADLIVARPFQGLPSEAELIALREFVPSATAELRLKTAGEGTPSITLGSVLPGAAAALTRADSSILIGMQVQTHSGDLSRDLAAAIEWALEAEPSSVLSSAPRATVGARLQDLLVDEPIDVQVHDDFQWWLDEEPEAGSALAVMLERANAAILPTTRLADQTGAYWVDTGDKAHVRWIREDDEAALLAAMARLAARDELDLGEGSRYVGSFRAHGCLVPVWDVENTEPASAWEKPAAQFADRLAKALAVTDPLSDDERRARDGILGRQFTLR